MQRSRPGRGRLSSLPSPCIVTERVHISREAFYMRHTFKNDTMMRFTKYPGPLGMPLRSQIVIQQALKRMVGAQRCSRRMSSE